jgi:protein SCO1
MKTIAIVFVAVFAVSFAGSVAQGEPRAGEGARIKVGGAEKDADAAAVHYFTNTELIDQEGRPHRFYNDLVRNKKVLINFAYTSCKGACPTMTANLTRVQKLLGDRAFKEITILTISVDPVNDTPKVLKEYAAKFGVGENWYFLTGTPENVATVLRRLGGQTEKPDEHAMTLLLGDASTGYWVKTLATAEPKSIVCLINHLNDQK